MKLQLNQQIAASRLPSYIPRFLTKETVADQVADLVIKRDHKPGYFLIYLPLDYHRQNPGYLAHTIDKNEDQRRKQNPPPILLVLILCQKQQEVAWIDDAQMTCLRKKVNIILCYDLKEVSNVIVDLIQIK